MKTLVLYTSKHGTTNQVATYINNSFDGDLYDILQNKPTNLNQYDLIIIGGPVYMGTLNSKLKSYIDSNIDILINRQLALFLVCLKEEEVAAEQFNHAYGSKLLEHSLTDGFFGGQVQGKLSPLERFITFISFDKDSLAQKVDYTEIDRFINSIKKQLI